MREKLIASIVYWLSRLLSLTLRFRLEDPANIFRADVPDALLFAIWHNRLAVTPRVRRKYLPGRKTVALVSASKDGEILARAMARFGFTPVRGSTSRRGKQALLEISRLVADGYDVAITPDGPRGPRYEVQTGIIDLAVLTGKSIVPVSLNFSHKLELKSWDRFQVPLPFARCRVRIGEPFTVPRDAAADTRETKRKELQDALLRLSD